MAHFALLWKARTIEKYRQNYENEKINSIFMSHSDMPDKTLFQKWKHYKHGMQKRLSRTFSKWYPEGSTLSNFFVNLRADMKLPSILLRSFYGFIGGLCITYLGFMFFVFQLSLTVNYATVLSSVLGVLLTLGLTFSDRMRCIIFLLIPQLFSRAGRYTLTCYALVLILTGPATNTLRNCELLSTSMARTQERIKLSVRQINDSIKKPYNSVKNSLKVTMKSMKIAVEKVKNTLININRLILTIASIIESNFKWFTYIADVCNNETGFPHEKCVKIMNQNPLKSLATYQLNEPRKHVKKSTNDYLRDLLRAFGVKNVNLPKDENVFDFGPYKKVISYPKRREDYNNRRDSDAKGGIGEVVKEKNKNCEKPWFLDKVKLYKGICAPLKSYEKFFVPADFAEVTYVATMRKKLKTFVSRLKALLTVRLNVQHTYSFIGNSSSNGHIACGVVTEIKSRADPILTWLSWSSCVTSLFLLLIIFRAKNYQRMFETRSRFDNRFITKEFRELDLKRLREARETVLPLNARERAKYVTTTSFRLVASEKLHLNRSAVFMSVATFKLLIHIVADYSLYWVLVTIRHYGDMQTTGEANTVDIGASITGNGFVSRFLQSLVDSMKSELEFPPPDKSNLPNPYTPDVKRYCQIGFLIFLLWFFALLEPYGLRLRHLIMGHYRPQRAKDRAMWLYNHILRTRASFMKFARRKLHREYKYSTHSHMTFRGWLQTYAPCRWLCFFLGMDAHDEPRCLLCNITEDKADINKELIRCEVPKCPGNYCSSCFGDIGQLCTICLSPSDYGDFSDASLELGSSDEDDCDGDHCRRPNRDSNKRHDRDTDYDAFQNDSYFVEEPVDEEASSSSRISKQKYYTLGRKEESYDTTPLLKHQHSEVQYQNNYGTNNTNVVLEDDKIDEYRKICKILPKSLQTNINNKVIYNAQLKGLTQHLEFKIITTLNIVQYSVYEITKNPINIIRYESSSDFGNFLRKNKLIRRKKYILSRDSYWEQISNSAIREKAKKNKGGEARKNKMYLNKSKKLINQQTPNNLKKPKPNDLQNKEEKCSTNIDTKKGRHKAKIKIIDAPYRALHTTFTKLWQNMKHTIISVKGDKDDDSPIKNHNNKRKKKRKKIIELSRSGSVGVKLGKKGNFIGNSRLFAYLDERDWVKTFESDADLQKADDGVVVRKNSIIVNNITIPKLELDISNDSLDEKHIRDIFKSKAFNIVGGKRKRHSKCAIGKFLKSIICSSCEFLVFEGTSHDNVGGERNKMIKLETNDIESFKEDIIVKKQKTDCSRTIKCSPRPEPHSATYTKCVSSSEEDNCGFHIKRSFSNPLSIVKNIYSTLSFTKTDIKVKKCCHKKGNCKKSQRYDNGIEFEETTKKDKTKEIQDNDYFQESEGINNNKTQEVLQNYYQDYSETGKWDKTNEHDNYIQDYKETKKSKPKAKQRYDFQDHREIISDKQIKLNSGRTKSNLKTVVNKNKKPARAVLFLKDDQSYDNDDEKEEHNKVMTPRRIIKKSDSKGIQTISSVRHTKNCDKAVTVCPAMVSCGCQNICCKRKTEDFAVQVSARIQKPKLYLGLDAEAMTCNKTCSCAAQCHKDCRDAETCHSQCQNLCRNAATVASDGLKYERKVEREVQSPTSSTTSTATTSSDSETKTDTTICSLANVDYRLTQRNIVNSPKGKYKVKVVTKSNQSTITEKANRCDVSTATYDWWSPIIEKKVLKDKTLLDRKRKEYDMQKVEKRPFRSKGIMAGEKTVTFRSKTQFIPSHYGFGDIMSPSRYLLESQKYYNELFYNIFNSPRIYPIANVQKFPHHERDRSQTTSNHKRRKGHKTKRLEDTYTPRRNGQGPWSIKIGPEKARKNKRN